MNSDISVCPFCNAFLPPLPAPALDKLPCPSCGEPIPAARWKVDRTLRPSVARDIERKRQALPGIRPTAYAILGVMAMMAVVGLSYMLWTTKERRARDPKAAFEPIAFRKPLELSGFAYLPRGSQFVAGLQIAEMMDDKSKIGKQLLAEPRPAALDWLLKQILRTTALPLESIDHVLMATSFDDHFPRLVVVVKTRPKYRIEKIVAAIQPTRSTLPSLHEGKPLYEFSLKPVGEAMLWCIEENTLLYVIRPSEPRLEDLQGLSATPAKDLREVLPAPLYQALEQRLPKYQFAWIVGQPEKLSAVKDWLPLVPIGKGELDLIQKIKILALGIEPVEGLTLTGHFLMSNASAAAELKTFLESVPIRSAKARKVEAPPPEEKEQWLTWQVRSDLEGVRALMNGDRDSTKK